METLRVKSKSKVIKVAIDTVAVRRHLSIYRTTTLYMLRHEEGIDVNLITKKRDDLLVVNQNHKLAQWVAKNCPQHMYLVLEEFKEYTLKEYV